jgi:hypothetical protein
MVYPGGTDPGHIQFQPEDHNGGVPLGPRVPMPRMVVRLGVPADSVTFQVDSMVLEILILFVLFARGRLGKAHRCGKMGLKGEIMAGQHNNINQYKSTSRVYDRHGMYHEDGDGYGDSMASKTGVRIVTGRVMLRHQSIDGS